MTEQPKPISFTEGDFLPRGNRRNLRARPIQKKEELEPVPVRYITIAPKAVVGKTITKQTPLVDLNIGRCGYTGLMNFIYDAENECWKMDEQTIVFPEKKDQHHYPIGKSKVGNYCFDMSSREMTRKKILGILLQWKSTH